MKFSSLYKLLIESSIDYPQEKGLCPEVWDKDQTLKPSVKEKILSVLKKFNQFDLFKFIENIRVVGSICSNRWVEDSDIDVHLTLNKNSDETLQKQIITWFNSNRDQIDGWIGEHPIEVYWQFNYFQDLASEGVWDLSNDTWIVKPRIVDVSYDPYDTFKNVHADLKDIFKELDVDIGELKRDIIDYETIEKAIKQLPSSQKIRLEEKLKQKLIEIDKDIETLSQKKKQIADSRKAASSPTDEDSAKRLRDDETWIKTNAKFKFIAKYGYLYIITELQKIKDEQPDKKVKEIEKILKEK